MLYLYVLLKPRARAAAAAQRSFGCVVVAIEAEPSSHRNWKIETHIIKRIVLIIYPENL